MKALTEEQLNDRANKIAELIAETQVEQRHMLYDRIALKLDQRVQSFSGSLFTTIARLDRGG